MGFWHDMEEGGVLGVLGYDPDEEAPKPIQAAVNSAFEKLQNDQAKEAADTAEEIRTLTEVEKRLRKANYYQAVLGQELFEGSASEEALMVEAEIREFALKRLRVLLGIEVEETQLSRAFSRDEEVALKTWAAKLLGRPATFQPEPERKTSTVLPVAEPKLRTLADSATATVSVKRRPGRPLGSGNKKKDDVAPASVGAPVRTIVEKEVMKADGTTGTIKMDVTPAVQPNGAKPAPMPDPTSMFLMEAARAEEQSMQNPVLRQFDRATGTKE